VPSARSIPSVSRLLALGLVLLASLSLGALTAPAALSATGTTNGNAFGELTGGGQTEAAKTVSTATTTRGSTSESSNSQSLIILALVAAVLLLVGIAFVISRDARKVAPVTEGELTSGMGSRDWAAKQRRRRTKAKAARQQRKRNR
jgi:hypothetical protein